MRRLQPTSARFPKPSSRTVKHSRRRSQLSGSNSVCVRRINRPLRSVLPERAQVALRLGQRRWGRAVRPQPAGPHLRRPAAPLPPALAGPHPPRRAARLPRPRLRARARRLSRPDQHAICAPLGSVTPYRLGVRRLVPAVVLQSTACWGWVRSVRFCSHHPVGGVTAQDT